MLRRFIFLLLALVVASCGSSNQGPKTSTIAVGPPEGTLAPIGAADVPNKEAWSDADAPVPVSSKDPMIGKRDALVTIVLFTDLQCPFCARVRPTLVELRKIYGDDLRIVWKNLPLSFHVYAEEAAEMAYGVFTMKGNDAFWSFANIAFDNQPRLTHDDLVSYARSAGVDNTGLLEAQVSQGAFASKVNEDRELAARLGATGTPTLFINGIPIVGAQPLERFKSIIDAELAKAQALVNNGTPRSRAYVAASKANLQKLAELAAGDDDDEPKDDTKTVFKIPAGNAPVRGNANALVTIVEFGDFQCPYCARVQPTIEALRTKYGNDLRVLFRHEPLPFHPRAEPAAEMALEARAEKGDAGFWAAHDMLFANQKALDDNDLRSYAGKLGLNVGAVGTAISAHKFKSTIDADAEVAEDFQANGTPHFFINGRRLVGAQPQEKFEKIIDEELVKARALLSAGTPAAKIYEKLTESGRTPPEPEKKTVALPKNAPSKGNAKAKVVIQEFSDFQCPFCGRAESTIEEVMKNYGTRVRFVWRNLPLPMHADAPLAAQAGVEAFKQKGSDGFWKLHDMMFANQKDLSRATLDGYAQQIGLDMKRWNAALDNATNKPDVDADAAAADAAGISGTPAFIINGYYISGAQPYVKFKKIIERALAEAK